jgi:hypothetical protein
MFYLVLVVAGVLANGFILRLKDDDDDDEIKSMCF